MCYSDLMIGIIITASEDLMNGAVLIINFPQNICGYDYLHHLFALEELYISALFYGIYRLY